jgi:TolB protein
MPRLTQDKLRDLTMNSRTLISSSSLLFTLFLSNVALPALGDQRQVVRILFTSQGKTGSISPDGSLLDYFDFDVPNQATWQPGPIFPDGKRLVFLSMEPRRDGPGRPFEEYYTQTPTHLWLHDLEAGSLEELATRDRLAPFITPALLVGNERMLVQVVKNRVGQIWNMKLDGSDAKEFTRADEGLPYGFSLSPDERRIAFHLASPSGYQVWTSDIEGRNRVQLAAAEGHLYFGTSWSPDGQQVVYVDCIPRDDPGHDWADVCIARDHVSSHRVLTKRNAMWFAATYGNAENRGGGSNVPSFTSQGKILFPRRIQGSRVAWTYRVGQPDLDHFNRDYRPDQAKGGTAICQLDPATGEEVDLTPPSEGVWDFRAVESPDGKFIAFCRAKTGESPALWVMNADGTHPRLLTRGINDRGADHPRWLAPAIEKSSR